MYVKVICTIVENLVILNLHHLDLLQQFEVQSAVTHSNGLDFLLHAYNRMTLISFYGILPIACAVFPF